MKTALTRSERYQRAEMFNRWTRTMQDNPALSQAGDFIANRKYKPCSCCGRTDDIYPIVYQANGSSVTFEYAACLYCYEWWMVNE